MKRILIIEDESALQKTLGEILTQEGYETISALDGGSGLDLAKAKSPDLILLDLILPKMNGFDVLTNLKKDNTTKGIPVIVLTNLEGVAEIDRVISLGATAYLVKAQYSLEELVARVKQVLDSPM
ncbi:MAG: response regulator receiver modulated diguanylate cyclase/phosphodiesterase [Parcubacteria group bacterium GW2011_GWC1_38_6]|nr:MAG: Transcriptional regulatory protein WalR [Parcubacteria group bacterium GW2011_GWA1_36_12]KKQ76860.1 MAG: response regulator receiver modulated diguanylate cyclase/phosphodiesterase [Parcubacteria group bacterium GW2011_GWC1_38_6]